MAEDIFDEKNIPQANWMQFLKVNDRIQGTLVGVSEKPAEGQFPAQKIYKVLVKDDGVVVIDGKNEEPGEWNVGLSVKKSYIHDRLGRAKTGQKIGFKFVKEIPSATKGLNPAKSINPYLGEMDKDYIFEDKEVNVDDVPFD